MIAYTSGTTGRPKGALLSHRNLITTSENYAEVESVRRGDNWLAYLPMAWVGDTILSLSSALVGGVTVNTPESPETVRRDLRELGPHGMIAPPRIWETLLTDIQVKAADASWLKRRTFEYFRDLSQRRELMKSDGKSIPLSMQIAYRGLAGSTDHQYCRRYQRDPRAHDCPAAVRRRCRAVTAVPFLCRA